MIRNAFIVYLLSCGITLGQSTSVPVAPLSFEVASIHPHQGPLHVIRGFSSSGSRLTLDGYARWDLVLEAYDLKNYQLVWPSGSGPQDDIYYDIVAKSEGDAEKTKTEFRQMLQTLLTQRFHLRAHAEVRDIAVYALTVSKSGPKFKQSSLDAPTMGLNGVHGRNQTLERPRETMEELATDIPNAFMMNRPVVNRTGLAGTYDIKLEATPEFRIESNSQPEDLSVFTAVQDQLGLKLMPAKAVVQVLVVDHIESPSEN